LNLEFSGNGFIVAFGGLEAPPLQRVESTVGDLGVHFTRQQFRSLHGSVCIDRKFEPEIHLFRDGTVQPGIRLLHDLGRNIVVLIAMPFQES